MSIDMNKPIEEATAGELFVVVVQGVAEGLLYAVLGVCLIFLGMYLLLCFNIWRSNRKEKE